MITRLEIEGFKAFGARQIATLAPITLIYGTNSSGKSALLQSLLFLKQSDEVGYTTYTGPHVDLASARHVTFRHEESLRPSVAIACRPRCPSLKNLKELAVGVRVGREAGFAFDLEIVLDGKPGPRINMGAFVDKPDRAAFLDLVRSANPEWSEKRWSRVTQMFDTLPEGFLFSQGPRQLMPVVTDNLEFVWSMWDDSQDPENSDEFEEVFAKLSEDEVEILLETFKEHREDIAVPWTEVSRAFSGALSRVGHLGPVRPAPARQLSEAAGATSTLQSLKGEAREQLAMWCSYLGLPYEFTAETLGDAASGVSAATRVTDLRNSLTLALTDVGYGVSQVLPLLLKGLDGGRYGSYSTALVEQPELHLHPRQQGHLADFFLWSSGLCNDFGKSITIPKTKSHTQWILETHSEALISRIQRRIRQGLVDPKQVSVVFVEPGPEGSRLIPLRLNESGEFIDEWPGGFFEETYWDLFGGLQ